MGGGPVGSFFSYFLLQVARRTGLTLHIDIYQPRGFFAVGPKGCNMCGGIISESLVQNLAAEGINLPTPVVQRGIDSYFLHMEVGSVRIETPLQEMRIAAVHRGADPRGAKGNTDCRGFDGYLLELAVAQGAQRVGKRVDGVTWEDGRPQLKTQDGHEKTYDLLAVATNVNTPALKLFEGQVRAFKPPQSTKTYICELYMGRETIQRSLGTSMHVFLINIPRLEFAALIPKGDNVTMCLLGKDIDKGLVQSFFHAPEVTQCLPADWQVPEDFCHCSPKLNIRAALHPFADRVVFNGDCGVTRLYKDGIGAAYRTAKAAAITAVFEGIAAEDFRQHFWPACQYLATDNQVRRIVFAATRQIQERRFLRRGVWRMVAAEQQKAGGLRRMSMVLWDTFTGSAPYRSVFLRTLHAAFWGRLLWETLAGCCSSGLPRREGKRS